MRSAHIRVEIYEENGNSHCSVVAPNQYLVQISLAQAKNFHASLEEVIAHELGHVVSFICESPNHVMPYYRSFESDVWMAKENEAWDAAYRILHFEDTKKRALETHRQAIARFGCTQLVAK